MRLRLAAGLIAVLAAAAIPRSAGAQPVSGIGCDAADFSLTFTLFLPTATDGSGAPAPEGLQGSLEIHNQKVPRELRMWSLAGLHPVQFWNLRGDLRMMILLGTPEDRFTLTIQAREEVQGGGAYAGTFQLGFGRLKLSGQLACTQG